jgi:hypothetical protein
MTTLIILIPIGYIYRKELKKCLDITFEWYYFNLKKDIEENKTKIIFKEPEERTKSIPSILWNIGSTYVIFEKLISKDLPKTCKKLLKFLKK